MPPRPPSWRGRLGAIPVAIVRRALFWVWPPLHEAFAVLCRVLERLIRMLLELEDRLAAPATRPPSTDGALAELAEVRIQLERLEGVQADAWLEVAKLRAEVLELRSARVRGNTLRAASQ